MNAVEAATREDERDKIVARLRERLGKPGLVGTTVGLETVIRIILE